MDSLEKLAKLTYIEHLIGWIILGVFIVGAIGFFFFICWINGDLSFKRNKKK